MEVLLLQRKLFFNPKMKTMPKKTTKKKNVVKKQSPIVFVDRSSLSWYLSPIHPNVSEEARYRR